ncbi:MAG: 3-oxoacyl-ACP reductase [Pseudonocardiales bacterium]|nr:3-oxoacyl-ACP reductase [Pseudonocardiales bacterium]
MKRRRVAVVTGGGGGIGRAVVDRLLTDGWQVFAADLSFPDAGNDGDTTDLSSAEALTRLRCDVSNPADVEAVFAAAAAADGPLAGVVLAAGIAPSGTPLQEVSLDLWNRVLAVNLTGSFLCLKSAIPMLRANADGPDGRAGAAITLISSTSSERPSQAGIAPYAATKGAVNALVRELVLEFTGTAIRINSVSPGPTNTHIVADMGPDWIASKVRSIPNGRLAQPEDVAGVVAFTLSDDARHVTGMNLIVDGGMTAVVVPQ